MLALVGVVIGFSVVTAIGVALTRIIRFVIRPGVIRPRQSAAVAQQDRPAHQLGHHARGAREDVFGADRTIGHAVVLINIDRFLPGTAVLAVVELDLALALVVVFEDGDLVVFFHALQSVVVVPGQGTAGFVVVVDPTRLIAVGVVGKTSVADVRRGVRLAALVVIAPVVGGGPVFPFPCFLFRAMVL